MLLNISGGPNMSLHEIEEAASIIQQTADPEANIIVGQVINPDMGDDLVVTVIATGFERDDQPTPVGVASQARMARTGQPSSMVWRSPIGRTKIWTVRPIYAGWEITVNPWSDWPWRPMTSGTCRRF